METLRHELSDFHVDVITVESGIYRHSDNITTDIKKGIRKIWEESNEKLRSAYGEDWIRGVERVLTEVIETSPSDLSSIADNFYSAILARYPYKNIVIGNRAYLLYRPYSWLPTRMQETVTRAVKCYHGFPTPYSSYA
ncbi:hypothetical protein AB6A40_006127 [Gnathostoma spinigerum]|uniref:Uncharacterized protein n=1 Tax=Gnathostoma spinigerum TaxID=75299 RepID=A0ABD6EHH4_9BILA